MWFGHPQCWQQCARGRVAWSPTLDADKLPWVVRAIRCLMRCLMCCLRRSLRRSLLAPLLHLHELDRDIALSGSLVTSSTLMAISFRCARSMSAPRCKLKLLIAPCATVSAWRHCSAVAQFTPALDVQKCVFGMRVGLASWYISARGYQYILHESGIFHIMWMRRPNNCDALLYGRFGSIPFGPALD
jgi:hypothetical protein